MGVGFSKRAVGLDIADHTIELVEIVRKGKKGHIRSKARMALKDGIVKNGEIMDEVKLTKALETLFSKAKPRAIKKENIVVGIPESQVYMHVFRLKSMDEKDIPVALARAMERIIPLPPKDVWYNYTIENKEADEFEILVVAIKRSVFLAWDLFFKNRGFIVDSFDIESLAVHRGLSLPKERKAICVVDIGDMSTHVGIHDDHGLRHSYTLHTAGHHLSLAIAEAEGITALKAEKKKQLRGLKIKKAATRESLEGVLMSIGRSIQDTISYVEEQKLADVSHILIVGGSAKMPRLREFFSKQFSIPVAIGKSELYKEAAVVYTEAVGLAYRGLFSSRFKDDISFSKDVGFLLDRQIPSTRSELIKTYKSNKKRKKNESTKKSSQSFFKKHSVVIITALVALLVGVLAFTVLDRTLPGGDEKVVVEDYRYFELVPMSIPVSVDEREYASDRLKARSITITVTSGSSEDDAKKQAMAQAEKSIGEGETLWPDVVRINKENNAFEFLVYRQETLDTFVTSLISSDIEDEFLVRDVSVTNVFETKNSFVYLADIQVNIAFTLPPRDLSSLKGVPEGYIILEEVEIASTTDDGMNTVSSTVSSTEMLEEALEFVIILETGAGYLNVRDGAGSSFPVVTTVDVGEEYVKLQESEDKEWIQIQVTDDQTGWVSSEFIE